MRRLNTCGALLDDRLDRDAALVAIVTPEEAWDRARLARSCGALAGWLAGRGVRRGDVVAIAMPDSPAWVAAFLAVLRIGAVAALASPAHPRDRLAPALARLGARLILSDDPSLAPGILRAPAAEVAAAAAEDRLDPGLAATSGDDPAYLLLTSGTTGPSKWAVHRHRDIPACAATYGRRVLRLGPGDVTASVAGLATSYGLGNTCYFPLAAGAAAWIAPDQASPAGVARACTEGGATALFGVPTSWARLARHVAEGRIGRDAFAGVRLAVAAGEPLPPAVWASVERATGLRLVNGLGSSEATNLYCSDRPGSPRPGTVGWPVAGYRLRIVPLPGQDPDGHEGELLVRGPTLMSGYLGDPAASDRALAGGWLHTGDLVRREADGSHTVLGRAGDRVKVGALWVDPARVEAALMADPAVSEVVVTGVEDAEGLLRLVAVVGAPAGPADLDARLAARCRAGLAVHEVPRAFRVVDRLPTSASGKVNRGTVREIARAALAVPAPSPEGAT
ncbi:MAG: AMP-binding protein [Thermoleophilia bacterium]|nr:AMP-binding protein [Thermoleophilia bacterium]